MEKKEWKYCVVGNIVKTHYDNDGVLRYGTPAFTGGTKVYLCGRKWWDLDCEEISVLGLTRFKDYQVVDIRPELIENVRCSKIYKPSVIAIMDNYEFNSNWWNNTKEDRLTTQEFVEKWNEKFGND